MTLEQLKVFVAIAEHGHVTRAATALGRTQSAVSASLAALESRHGVSLFDRIGRGVELSEAGRVFLPEARAVLGRADAALRALDDLTGLRRGRLALAASQTVASYWLPRHVAAFAAAYPGIELALSVGNTGQVAEWLLSGDADLGFVEGPLDEPRLTATRVASDRVALYAAPGHPLAGRPLAPDDLRDADWILREAGSGTRSHFERSLAALGIGRGELKIRFEAPSNEALLAAVEAGGLVTAVSTLAAASATAAGRIVQLRVETPQRDFRLARHAERRPSRAAEAFVERLGLRPG